MPCLSRFQEKLIIFFMDKEMHPQFLTVLLGRRVVTRLEIQTPHRHSIYTYSSSEAFLTDSSPQGPRASALRAA